MIESVVLYKAGQVGYFRGVSVRYKDGAHRSYSFNRMPKTLYDFILREDVKAYENEFSVLYR